MDAPWFRRRRRGDDPTARPRRKVRLEFTVLEERRVPVIGVVTETITPKVLVPNKGEGYTVTVSGKVQQVLTYNLPTTVTTRPSDDEVARYQALNSLKPGPSSVLALVTDQYRRVEPRVHTNVEPTVTSYRNIFRPGGVGYPPALITVRNYDYSFPLRLQAKASSIGRQYDVTVFISDFDGGGQALAFAFVPGKPGQVKAAPAGGRAHGK